MAAEDLLDTGLTFEADTVEDTLGRALSSLWKQGPASVSTAYWAAGGHARVPIQATATLRIPGDRAVGMLLIVARSIDGPSKATVWESMDDGSCAAGRVY